MSGRASSSGRKGEWEDSVARAIGLGVGAVSFFSQDTALTGKRGTLRIPCTGGHSVDVELTTKYPHDVIKKKLQQIGWDFRHKPTCPDCANSAKRQKEETRMGTQDNAVAVPAAPPTEKERSAAMKLAHRQIIANLEEVYDDTKKRYHDGFNDKSIATEVGCAEAYVAEVREQFFGPLGEPPELIKFREDVRKLRERADDLERDAKAAADSLRADAGRLEERIARIALANGWKE